MADIPGFTNFETEYPVLQSSNVESAATGYEEFGKTLANLASQGQDLAGNLAEQESKSQYVNSVANIEQVKTKAQEQMIENPWAAQKIQDSTNQQLDSIQKNTKVNAGDRNQLKLSVVDAQDEVGLKATETSYKQAQLGAAFTHYVNFPDQLKAYQDALMTDPAKAENLKEAMVSSLRGLVTTGALTPNEAGNSIKSMQALVDNTQRLHEGLVDPNFSAQQFHTLNGTVTNPNKNDADLPIDGSTQWMTDFYNNDKSLQGVLSDVTNFKYPNPAAVLSLSKDDYAHAMQTMQGAQVAYGMINSGTPFPALEAKYKDLALNDKRLSYADQGTRDSLKTYIGDLKNGNFLEVMGNTPAGNRILQGYTQSLSAIDALGVSDDQKNAMRLQAKNKMVSDAATYGAAHHIPSQYIQPIPNSEVATLKNAFTAGQDPSQVINILGQYTKQNQMYVAQAMGDPLKSMVVQGVALAGGDVDNQSKVNFIAANQTGAKYPPVDIQGENGDKAVMARMAAALAPQLKIIQANTDPQSFGLMQSAMLNSTLNYAKFLAQQDMNATKVNAKGQASASDWNNYADKAVQVYKSAFAPMTGTNWQVNSNALPQPLSSGQLDDLAEYAIKRGKDYLRGGVPQYEFESAYDRQPLTMTISPTGNVEAITGNGSVAFSEPYTTKMMAAAQSEAAAAQAAAKEARANLPANIIKGIGKQKGSLINVLRGQ